MNYNDKNKIKCLVEQHNGIVEFYCDDCDIPICRDCLELHGKHRASVINECMKDKVKSKFKSSLVTYKNEDEFLNNELKAIEKNYNETTSNFNNIKKQIADRYKVLHYILQMEENDLIKQIRTNEDENLSLFESKKDLIINKLNIFNSMTKNHDSNIQDHFESICEFKKKIYQSNKLLKPFNSVLQSFRHINLNYNINDDDFNFICDSLKSLFTITNKDILKYQYNNSLYKFILIDDNNNIIDDNSESIKDINQINLAISKENEYSNIPNCNRLLCLSSDSIPNINIFNSVQILILHNIKDILEVGSIPSVKHLYINDYQNSIAKNVIPYGVEELTLSNITQPLRDIIIPSSVQILRLDKINNIVENVPESITDLRLYNVTINSNSIPETVVSLTISNGFNNKLDQGVLPCGKLKSIALGHVIEPLLINSIPSSVDFLIFHPGYNHKIYKDTIPSTITRLHFYELLHPLDNQSIPETVKKISLCNGFNQKITNQILPEGLETLNVYNIKESFEVGSIPSSVKTINFQNGYNDKVGKGIIPNGLDALSLYNVQQPLDNEILPESIKEIIYRDGYGFKVEPTLQIEMLSVCNIEMPLEVGSISNSVTHLNICNGYKFKINKDIIPNTVKTLYINDICEELDSNSLPDSVENLYICDGYKHKISKGTIKPSIRLLSFGDIKEPLVIDTIPPIDNLHLHFGKGFKQNLDQEGVIPEGITSISISSQHFKSTKEISLPKSLKLLKLYNSVIKTPKKHKYNIQLHLNQEEYDANKKVKSSRKLKFLIKRNNNNKNNNNNNNKSNKQINKK